MQNPQLTISSNHHFSASVQPFHQKWTRFNTLTIVAIAHILFLALLVHQQPTMVNELAKRVTGIKLLNLSHGEPSLGQYQMTPTRQPLMTTGAISKQRGLSFEEKTNIAIDTSKETIEKTAIPVSVEKIDVSRQIEVKQESLASWLSDASKVQYDTKTRDNAATAAPTLSVDENSGKEIRIGERHNNIIEILQLGRSKAIYSIVDFSNQDVKQSFAVEVGDFPDIETAIVNDIINHLRNTYPNEILWNSKVKARFVKLSMLRKDHAAIEKFLRIEIFGSKNREKDYSFWDKTKF